MTTSTTTVLATDTIQHEPHASKCPCGCGFGATDLPASRYQILQTTAGTVLDTSRSLDGGRTFFGGGWQPCDSEGGHAYATRMVDGRAPNCEAWLQAHPGRAGEE